MGTVERGEATERRVGWLPDRLIRPGHDLFTLRSSWALEAPVEEGKGTRVIVCLRCQLEVSVTIDDRGLHLSYDNEHWIKRCCCKHRVGAVDCCSFLTLEGSTSAESRAPRG
jgi:hypothetical protein